MLQSCGNTLRLSHPVDCSGGDQARESQAPASRYLPMGLCFPSVSWCQLLSQRNETRSWWPTALTFPEQLCSVSRRISRAWCPADVSSISPLSFPSPCFPTAILHNITHCSCTISSFPYTLNSFPCSLQHPNAVHVSYLIFSACQLGRGVQMLVQKWTCDNWPSGCCQREWITAELSLPFLQQWVWKASQCRQRFPWNSEGLYHLWEFDCCCQISFKMPEYSRIIMRRSSRWTESMTSCSPLP